MIIYELTDFKIESANQIRITIQSSITVVVLVPFSRRPAELVSTGIRDTTRPRRTLRFPRMA